MKIELPVVLTPSRAENGSSCHRRHVLQDVLERGKYRSPSLDAGTIIHAGAAAWWLGKNVAQAVEEAWNKQPPQTDKLSLPMIQAIMADYPARAKLAGPLDDGEWQLVSVEERLSKKIGEVVLSFQTDRVLRHKQSGRFLVVDTKSAGRLNRQWEQKWPQSLQMKLYKAGNELIYDAPFDIAIEGVLKDVPTKIQYVLMPDWSEAMLAEALNQWEVIARKDAELIERATINGEVVVDLLFELATHATEFDAGSCFDFNTACQFLEICQAEPNERAALLKQYQEIPSEY
jgi:hypothetical protein